MCGIGGILRVWQPGDAPPAHADAIPEAWLDILDESIKHRGPDGRGRFRQRVVRGDGSVVDVALVHRRLSIIDHADGAQPMLIGNCATGGSPASAAPLAMISREGAPYAQLPTAADHHTCPKCGDGVVAVVFNGCIYNHRELRRELEAAGHVFHTDHSDTEVLLHGWREWGSYLGDRLDGMFAVAIWNQAQAALYTLRDLHGEKPLYCFDQGDARGATHAVASAVPGLSVVSERLTGRTALNQMHMHQWLAMGWSPGDTPFAEITQLPAGGGGVAPWGLKGSPWLDTRPSPESRPRESAPELLRDLADAERILERAVTSRLEADVPLGCFLSGGVDSSLVARFMIKHTGSLRTFSVRMPETAYDESEFAVRAAKAIGSDHETLECQPRPAEDLVGLIKTLGLPFGDSSLLPTYWIARAARRVVPVVLTGDGGDEMFCGYERHTIDSALERLHRVGPVLRAIPDSWLVGQNPKSRRTKAARLIRAAAHRGYQDLVAIFSTPDLAALAGRRATRWYHCGMSGTGHGRAYDAAHYLPGDLMRKVDTASMAVALESRSPLLAGELSRAALATPIRTLMPHGQRKGLLRAIARRYLPPDIVDRPKMGFAIPIGEWFRTDYGGMRQLLHDHLEAADPFPGLAESGVELNRDFIRQMLREHDAAGERSINPWHGRDHSQRLYMLLVLSIWCRWLRGL